MENALFTHFGYKEFRPLQREAVDSLLQGKDTFVLLPTGGGKSLCYQLPALLKEGTAIVVSPLIALMKDQVDALTTNGISATLLNSTLSTEELDKRKEEVRAGKYKLVYVAPERLLTTPFLRMLHSIPLSFFAIDEAHCISEWGHDFREEYRGLRILKERFPSTPIIALTATATPQVRMDILNQLTLDDPAVFTGSFNRTNLHYEVRPKSGQFASLMEFLRSRKGESGIIYCLSRNKTEQLATALQAEGIKALPYHAGLESTLREKTQDKFDKDKIEIICATIAFGMGIDKSNVRFVVHYDLPKNLANYYQETGRAGRDGLPSSCILYYNQADSSRHSYFIEEKVGLERQRAYQELEEMIQFAESKECRRRTLLGYFGEAYNEDNCGACDNCISDQQYSLLDVTEDAQKFLSCIARVREKFGLSYIVKVLRGSKDDRILQFRHHLLPTYGIGAELSKKKWEELGAQLISEEYVMRDLQNYGVLRITAKGWQTLRDRTPVHLKQAVQHESELTQSAEGPLNRALFEELRSVRRNIADSLNLPPYVVFSDATLQEISTTLPLTPEQLLGITGIGPHKQRQFGKAIIDTVRVFINHHPEVQALEKKSIIDSKREKKESLKKGTSLLTPSLLETKKLFTEGNGPREIAEQRSLSISTVYEHLSQLIESKSISDIESLVKKDRLRKIETVFAEVGLEFLRPAKEKLGDDISYEELKIVRAWIKSQEQA